MKGSAIICAPFLYEKYIMKILKTILAILIVLSFTNCGRSTESNAPSDHNVSKDGVYHKSGLNSPTESCVECHDADLRGGSSDVSCYDCHDKKW